MIDAFQPWEAVGPLIVPTPHALAVSGVPWRAVEVPYVAAATFDDMIRTAQIVACLAVHHAGLALAAQHRAENEDADG